MLTEEIAFFSRQFLCGRRRYLRGALVPRRNQLSGRGRWRPPLPSKVDSRNATRIGLRKAFDKNLRWLFEFSLSLKGIFAVFEIIAGTAAYFIDQQFLLNFMLAAFHDELQHDPHDFVANILIHAAQNFSVGTQLFISLYLLANGLTKAALITGLLRGKLGYYPVAIVVFVLFVVYQLYRYSFTHSIWLVLLTALDIIVIWLTWNEYKYLREARG